MWSSITTLIQQLPSWYIMLLLPFVIALGVWVYTRMRRDKNGKLYFYSQKYEDAKRNRKQDAILSKLNTMADSIIKNRRDILQLCADIPNPGKRAAYMEYHAAGFNSWADDYVVEAGLFTKDEMNFIKNNNRAQLYTKHTGNTLIRMMMKMKQNILIFLILDMNGLMTGRYHGILNLPAGGSIIHGH